MTHSLKIFVFVNLAWTVAAEWKGLDCPVDPDQGLDDPNNVYSCFTNETCCTKDLQPACCSTKPMDMIVSEQFLIWGVVLGLIIFLGLFLWFCRSSQSILDAETPCLQKFCSCKFPDRGDDGHLHEYDDEAYMGSRVSLQSKATMLDIQDEEAQQVEDDAANLEAVLEPTESEDLEMCGLEPPPDDEEEQENGDEEVANAEDAPPAEDAEPEPEEAASEEPPNEEAEGEGGDE